MNASAHSTKLADSAVSLHRAGRWFLTSGIQEQGGGVARFYRADLAANRAISTEITGYAASTLMVLHTATGDAEYLERARHTARFLAAEAWDTATANYPFEYGPGAEPFFYFFDCGIIVRGLLAVWRVTREPALLARAIEAGDAMLRDFENSIDIDPILTFPDKQPVARDWRWSRSSDCYQLKSALAWRDLGVITGEARFTAAFRRHLERSLATYTDFLPGNANPERVMDRLHPFAYFLESLVCCLSDPGIDKERCSLALADGIGQLAHYLHEIAPVFARSDVYAQLLRVRLWAAATVPLDRKAASQEAAALAKFQLTSPDPRIDGAFTFGTRHGEVIPHINPVSTGFAVQALSMWHSGALPPTVSLV